jgi:hypothetical protein
MVVKRVLCPQRLRRVPSQFSWVDHRLVRDRHIGRCSHPALALYLFLVTVCDDQGLSYWSDAKLGLLLRMDPAALAHARQELINARLVAYQSPLYQVLALDASPQPLQPSATIQRDSGPQPSATEPRLSEPEAIGQIFKRMLENAP